MKITNIEIKNICKVKNGKTILKNINLKITGGGRYILFGPSGAGKTTLLRLLNRMDDPTSGEILIDGQNIAELPILNLRKKIGLVFQIPVIFDGTVKDNLMAPYDIGAINKPPTDAELKHVLDLSGLNIDFLNRKASELSIGEKQRVNIARMLLNKPDVLLLDEPTSSLDNSSATRLLESIKELSKFSSLTIIMVTHQLEYAKLIGGQIIKIRDGSIVDEQLSEELLENQESFSK